MKNYIFTSESVTKGHPDKVCDLISDAILDANLAQDPYARVACETMVKNNTVIVAGEITSKADVNIEEVVRNTIKEIGYTKEEYGFNYATCQIINLLDKQSTDIAMGVDNALETRNSDNHDIGAGDQGMMFGFASNETAELMPLAISLAHKLALKLTEVRENGTLTYLRPDGKTQVSVKYEDDKPVGIDTIIISTQHDPDAMLETIRKDLIEYVIKPVIGDISNIRILVNPTGRFVIGGPVGDSGLTGRKIIVDTYGGYGAHGGGCFSGKDPTKVDRTAAYMARYIAKTLVKKGLAEKCQIEVAYAIGVAKPVSVCVDSYGTGKLTDEQLTAYVLENFDLRPQAIIDFFNLRRPIFKASAAYGHFGRDIFPWEQVK